MQRINQQEGRQKLVHEMNTYILRKIRPAGLISAQAKSFLNNGSSISEDMILQMLRQ